MKLFISCAISDAGIPVPKLVIVPTDVTVPADVKLPVTAVVEPAKATVLNAG